MSIFPKHTAAKLRAYPVPRQALISFDGGLDTETPKWNVPEGAVRSSKNMEMGVEGGYQDIQGLERYDGQASPSSAMFTSLEIDMTGTIAVADEVTQLVTAATGVVIAMDIFEGTQRIYLTKVTGTFDGTNDLQVAASTEATPLSAPQAMSSPTVETSAQYKALAADVYRADITAVPGAGPVRGVVTYKGDTYAIRNHASNIYGVLFKSSAAGWVEVPLHNRVSFYNGSAAFTDGAILTSSGETATIIRVALRSGSWDTNDAAGDIIYKDATGPFVADAPAVDDAGGSALAGDVGFIQILPPGGVYDFDINMFGGQDDSEKLYACNGVAPAFEFDGEAFVPIVTGMYLDRPTHVIVHANHLFLSFAGSAQHSGINTPYIWSPTFGAAELATGEEITGFMVEPGGEIHDSLGIYGRNRISILYGSSSDDWSLKKYRKEVGAWPGTIQQMGTTFYQDDNGITDLSTADTFGNFQHSVLTRKIQKLFDSKRNLAVTSCLSRSKNQYRIFFSDGTAFYCTINKEGFRGVMPIDYNGIIPTVSWSSEVSGEEKIFIGDDAGYVYQLDKGTSLDGAELDAHATLHFSDLGLLNWKKNFSGVSFEVSGLGYSKFLFTYQLGYNEPSIPQPYSQKAKDLNFTGAVWDDFIWDNFVWDGQTVSQSSEKLRGSAINISLILKKSSTYTEPALVSGALIRYKRGSMLRP